MSGELTDKQKIWLRGLCAAEDFVVMSASELGDAEASTLLSLELVQITLMYPGGRRWRITQKGVDAISP